MLKLRESKDLTPEQENLFLSVLYLEIQMRELSDKYRELEKKKEKLLEKTGLTYQALGKFQGWSSCNEDAQEIVNYLKK